MHKIVLLLVLSTSIAHADKPSDTNAIAAARTWLAAMHVHDLDAAVAASSSALTIPLCAKPPATAGVRELLACAAKDFGPFRDPTRKTWIDKSASWGVVAPKTIDHSFAPMDTFANRADVALVDVHMDYGKHTGLSCPNFHLLFVIESSSSGPRVRAVGSWPVIKVC